MWMGFSGVRFMVRVGGLEWVKLQPLSKVNTELKNL